MIVRDDGRELVLIRQPDHAALAGRVMTVWRDRDFPARPTREAALLATAVHDDGWLEEDESPQWDPASGKPFEFVAHPLARRQALWPRAVARAGERSAYVAALVAQHAITAYRHYERDGQWREFFRTMEQLRETWYHAPPRGPAALDPPAEERLGFLQDYAIVRLGDLISLAFCTGWTTPHECEGYHIQGEDRRVVITPDPFEGETVPLRVEGRRLARRSFESAAALAEAWREAPTVVIDGVAVGRADEGGVDERATGGADERATGGADSHTGRRDDGGAREDAT